jgi:hypothetical protein
MERDPSLRLRVTTMRYLRLMPIEADTSAVGVIMEMVERGSREGYERDDGEGKPRRLTQSSKKGTHLQECR